VGKPGEIDKRMTRQHTGLGDEGEEVKARGEEMEKESLEKF